MNPQHSRRIISDELRVLAYCTVCAWYQYTTKDDKLSDVLASWAIHLEKVVAHHRANPYTIRETVLDAGELLRKTAKAYPPPDLTPEEPFTKEDLDAKGHPV